MKLKADQEAKFTAILDETRIFSDLGTSQEEGDTHKFLHAKNVSVQSGTVTLVSHNTNVLVLYLAFS